jgi:hypothetical protein
LNFPPAPIVCTVLFHVKFKVFFEIPWLSLMRIFFVKLGYNEFTAVTRTNVYLLIHCIYVHGYNKLTVITNISFSRATPKKFSLYQTCVNYYILQHSQAHLEVEDINLQNVTLNDRRNKMLTFVRVNRSRAGLNNITNRLCSVTNMLDKTWINLSRDIFKSTCKKHIIQSQLQLLH